MPDQGPAEPKTEIKRVRFSREEAKRLEQVAAEKGTTVSEVIRDGAIESVKEHEKK